MTIEESLLASLVLTVGTFAMAVIWLLQGLVIAFKAYLEKLDKERPSWEGFQQTTRDIHGVLKASGEALRRLLNLTIERRETPAERIPHDPWVCGSRNGMYHCVLQNGHPGQHDSYVGGVERWS